MSEANIQQIHEHYLPCSIRIIRKNIRPWHSNVSKYLAKSFSEMVVWVERKFLLGRTARLGLSPSLYWDTNIPSHATLLKFCSRHIGTWVSRFFAGGNPFKFSAGSRDLECMMQECPTYLFLLNYHHVYGFCVQQQQCRPETRPAKRPVILGAVSHIDLYVSSWYHWD